MIIPSSLFDFIYLAFPKQYIDLHDFFYSDYFCYACRRIIKQLFADIVGTLSPTKIFMKKKACSFDFGFTLEFVILFTFLFPVSDNSVTC